MVEIAEFELQLEQRLQESRDALTQSQRDLSTHVTQLRSSFTAIYNVLVKKGVLRIDPYNYEERATAIEIPPDDPFIENERDVVLSVRLSHYLNQLAYLTDYADLTVDGLGLRETQQIAQLIQYINWQNLTENAARPTTRGLGELIAKIKRADALSSRIVEDAKGQLANAARQTLVILKRIQTYHRELYKLRIRHAVFHHRQIPACPPEQQQDRVLSIIKANIKKLAPGEMFIRELIIEIFHENEPSRGPQIREALFSQLPTAPKNTPSKEKPIDLRPELLAVIGALAQCGPELERVVERLGETVVVFHDRPRPFSQRLGLILQRLAGRHAEHESYPIEYINPTDSARRTETVEYETFVTTTMRRAHAYREISSRHGNAWKIVESLSEEDLLTYTTKEMHDVARLTVRMSALETYFRAEIPRAQRAQLSDMSRRSSPLTSTSPARKISSPPTVPTRRRWNSYAAWALPPSSREIPRHGALLSGIAARTAVPTQKT